MKSKVQVWSVIAITPFLFACGPRAVETMSGGEVMMSTSRGAVESRIASWPMKQRETATMIMNKYGEPDMTSDRALVWHNEGPFVKIELMRDEVAHDWPMPHTDFLTQTIRHRVPDDKVDDLFRYDGSVWVQRTRGYLSAQCDIEANNYLALNIAHDIITGKRSVSDARDFFAKTAMAYKNGDRSSPYMTGLIFPTEPNAGDRDMPHKM